MRPAGALQRGVVGIDRRTIEQGGVVKLGQREIAAKLVDRILRAERDDVSDQLAGFLDRVTNPILGDVRVVSL